MARAKAPRAPKFKKTRKPGDGEPGGVYTPPKKKESDFFSDPLLGSIGLFGGGAPTQADYGTQPNYTPSASEVWQYNADMRKYRSDSSEGDGGGGGYASPTTVTYGNPRSPSSGVSWWKPLTYQGGGAAEILASSANALIPALGGDEQTNIAKWLGTNFTDFSSYSNAPATPVSADMAAMRTQMFSKDRASKAIDSLEMMRQASGASEDQMGAGYAFLKKTASLLGKYSGEGGISRANYNKMQAEFEAMLGGIDSSYQELGRAMINPSVGGNPLMQSYRNNGRDSFGIPNAKLFT